MSTKIFNGYKFSRVLTVPELQWFNNDMVTSLREVADDRVFKKTINACSLLNDRILVGDQLPAPLNFHTLPAKWSIFSKVNSDLLLSKRSKEDYNSEWVILYARRKMLALFFTQQDVFQSKWESSPYITPFPYWDNTDKPSSISNQSWKNRGKVWDEALKFSTPAVSGLSCQVYSNYEVPLIPEIEQVITNQPSIKERIDALTDYFIGIHYQKEVPFDGTSYYSYSNHFRTWLKSPNGLKSSKKIASYLSKYIKLPISDTDLLKEHNCITLPSVQHKSCLDTVSSNNKILAQEMAQLRYSSLQEFLAELSQKLYQDGAKDLERKRTKLSKHLQSAADHISKGSKEIEKAWHICEPYMQSNPFHLPLTIYV